MSKKKQIDTTIDFGGLAAFAEVSGSNVAAITAAASGGGYGVPSALPDVGDTKDLRLTAIGAIVGGAAGGYAAGLAGVPTFVGAGAGLLLGALLVG